MRRGDSGVWRMVDGGSSSVRSFIRHRWARRVVPLACSVGVHIAVVLAPWLAPERFWRAGVETPDDALPPGAGDVASPGAGYSWLRGEGVDDVCPCWDRGPEPDASPSLWPCGRPRGRCWDLLAPEPDASPLPAMMRIAEDMELDHGWGDGRGETTPVVSFGAEEEAGPVFPADSILGRGLPRRPRAKSFLAGHMPQCELPSGFEWTVSEMADFVLYHAGRGEDLTAHIGMYLGGLPNTCAPKQARSEEGVIASRAATWAVWTDKEGKLWREAKIDFGEAGRLHVWVCAWDRRVMDKLVAGLRGLRFVARDGGASRPARLK